MMHYKVRCGLIFASAIVFQAPVVQCQGGLVWTWLGGDQIVDRASTQSHPGARSGASTWHDVHTNLTWMFGGRGFSHLPSGKPHLLSDLWQFSPSVQEKPEMRAPYFKNILPEGHTEANTSQALPQLARQHAALCGTQYRLVLFGGLGENGEALGDLMLYDIHASTWTQVSKQSPAARGDSAVWCFGPFMYLFGGISYEGKILDDMWRLNLFSLEWTLLHNSQAAAEGSSSLSSQAYYPEGRNGPATWVSSDALYMMGGNTKPSPSFSLHLSQGLSSDLWVFFPCNSTWELVRGSTEKQQSGVHASAKEYSTINVPCSRLGAASWVDSDGGLWLFGGAGVGNQPVMDNKPSQVLSDVWRFNPKLKAWAFIGGSDKGDQAGHYQDLGQSTEEGLPGARTGIMVFPGSCVKTFIFGGVGHDGRGLDGYLNDLWSVDVSAVLEGHYAISALSLLLFLTFCLALLAAAMLIGLRGRHSWSNHMSEPGHAYKQLHTEEDVA